MTLFLKVLILKWINLQIASNRILKKCNTFSQNHIFFKINLLIYYFINIFDKSIEPIFSSTNFFKFLKKCDIFEKKFQYVLNIKYQN